MARGEGTLGQWRIGEPGHVGRRAGAGESYAADETVIEQNAREGADPEAERVEPRKGHVARADHQRDKIVAESEQNGHAHQEHHGRPVHGEQPVKGGRGYERVMRNGKLDADQQSLDARDHEENQCVADVENAQLLMVDGHHPAVDDLEVRASRTVRARAIETRLNPSRNRNPRCVRSHHWLRFTSTSEGRR